MSAMLSQDFELNCSVWTVSFLSLGGHVPTEQDILCTS